MVEYAFIDIGEHIPYDYIKTFLGRDNAVFNIGDKVFYPMHGVGIIESIEERTVLKQSAKYYILRFRSGKMTAMVPVDHAESVGLRTVIDESECTKVIEYLQSNPLPESDNWNQRYRDNMEKLRIGNIYGIADVVKCLSKRDAEKGLSSGERKMLLLARQVLATELMEAGGAIDDIELLQG